MSDLPKIADRVQLGESLRMVAADYRDTLLTDMGFDPEDAPEDLFVKETAQFMNKVCRHLGDRHGGDFCIAAALEEWVQRVDEYEAFDSLLANFDFPGRSQVLDRGRMLFPRTLTDHWGETAG